MSTRIRGESARRMAIEITGQQLRDHLGRDHPILINPISSERIEAILNASIVVSGTQEIVGVINIIDRHAVVRPFAGTPEVC